MIQLSQIDLGVGARENVLKVLSSGRLAQGPMVEQLEEGFASLCGTRHAIAVMSGTIALVGAIEALGLGPGDEVITSPFTFVASVNAILESGATATFVDVGPDFCVRPELLASAITPQTKAIMPVHLYGQMADMPSIAEIAAANGLPIIEDAAQSHFAECEGRVAGSFGIGCFSLYATKNMTTGEGGVITTDDDAIAERIRLLRNQGMRERYQYEVVGHNWRMTELQAAIGLPQLSSIEERTAQRKRNAMRLNALLEDIDGLVTPFESKGRSHVWHQYTVRVTPDARISRDELGAGLTKLGVGNGVYYPRTVLGYECYQKHPRVRSADVKAAETAAQEVLSLPVHPFLSDEELDVIAESVRRLMG